MLPNNQECVVPSLAIAPGRVDSSTIRLQCKPQLVLEMLPNVKTQYKITVGLSWEPPYWLHGGNRYEVSISDRVLGNDGSGINNPLKVVVMVSLYTEVP